MDKKPVVSGEKPHVLLVPKPTHSNGERGVSGRASSTYERKQKIMQSFTASNVLSFLNDHKISCVVAISAVLLWMIIGNRFENEWIAAKPSTKVVATDLLTQEFSNTSNFTVVDCQPILETQIEFESSSGRVYQFVPIAMVQSNDAPGLLLARLDQSEHPDIDLMALVESGSVSGLINHDWRNSTFNKKAIDCICPEIEFENCVFLDVAEKSDLKFTALACFAALAQVALAGCLIGYLFD